MLGLVAPDVPVAGEGSGAEGASLPEASICSFLNELVYLQGSLHTHPWHLLPPDLPPNSNRQATHLCGGVPLDRISLKMIQSGFFLEGPCLACGMHGRDRR